MIMEPEVLHYYEQGGELTRLREGRGRLEFWRTRDVLLRTLPPAPARVLDVGGGTGAHAEWPAAAGYEVELIDPVPLHVRAASELPGVTARTRSGCTGTSTTGWTTTSGARCCSAPPAGWSANRRSWESAVTCWRSPGSRTSRDGGPSAPAPAAAPRPPTAASRRSAR